MKLVLIGIPGAGKSTQGNLLSIQFGIPYLSTGHIFRNIAKEKTSMGRYVKEVMTSGLLMPDDKTMAIVEEYLARNEYKKGYILDGFPRTLNQAKRFKNGIDKVIYLDLPDKEALWRLAFRGDDRDDDTVTAIKKRIEVFNKQTRPVIEHYQKKGQLALIDGTKPIPEVNKEILKNLGKQLVKNKIEDWQQKKRIVIAVTGLPGSGKSEATVYFKDKKLPIIHFGNIVNDYIDKMKLEHNEKNHYEIRMGLRKEHGMAAFAILNLKKIEKALEKSSVVVLDGMRSFEEYEYLTKKLSDAKISIIALWAAKETRYSRIRVRKTRNTAVGKDRDLHEILDAHLGSTIAFADYIVMNDGSIEDLRGKLEHVYRQIYFS